MYLSIFDSGEKVAAEGLSIDPASLYSAFEHVACLTHCLILP